MKVFRRKYDNPIDKNGKKKPNELIGEVEIIKTLEESTKTTLKIVEYVKNGEGFALLVEKPVKGKNSGIRRQLKPLGNFFKFK